ncbi:hypothetical protein ACF0H5_019073 [Mactra antiquata]
MATTRTDYKFLARYSEQAERYQDMVNEMTHLVEGLDDDDTLDEEERSLLSVAYKNVVGARRSSWRVVNARLSEVEDEKKTLVQTMKDTIETEIRKHCGEILDLLTKKGLTSKGDGNAKVFFLKMKGDYYRYMVEICSDEAERNQLTDKGAEAYGEALDIAKSTLASTSPIRLGLALNYSVFFYEIKNSPTEACELAQTAFDEAIAGLEELQDDGESYKDSTLIMQLLRDNLTLWKAEREEEKSTD